MRSPRPFDSLERAGLAAMTLAGSLRCEEKNQRLRDTHISVLNTERGFKIFLLERVSWKAVNGHADRLLPLNRHSEGFGSFEPALRQQVWQKAPKTDVPGRV